MERESYVSMSLFCVVELYVIGAAIYIVPFFPGPPSAIPAFAAPLRLFRVARQVSLYTVIQSEDAVVNRVLSRSCRDELEHLTIMKRVAVCSDANKPSDENDNAVLRSRGLDIRRLDLVRHLSHLAQLLNNVLRALEGTAFKSHHGVLSL